MWLWSLEEFLMKVQLNYRNSISQYAYPFFSWTFDQMNAAKVETVTPKNKNSHHVAYCSPHIICETQKNPSPSLSSINQLHLYKWHWPWRFSQWTQIQCVFGHVLPMFELVFVETCWHKHWLDINALCCLFWKMNSSKAASYPSPWTAECVLSSDVRNPQRFIFLFCDNMPDECDLGCHAAPP